MVTGEAQSVILVDLQFKNMPREKACREAKARFNPGWHREQVEKFVKSKNWFAAIFHFSWLLKNDPKNEELRASLQTSYQTLKVEFEQTDRKLDAVLPAVVKEALKLIPADEENDQPDENEKGSKKDAN